jgi:H+/Cl- antiporter ClcA
MDKFIKDLQYSKVSNWFDWSENVPAFMVLILGACSFGLLGVIMKMLYEHIFAIKKLEDSNYVTLPLLGFLSGFISIGLSYLLPNIFLDGSSLINPVGLILFSLLFGFFIKEFIESLATKIFTPKNI